MSKIIDQHSGKRKFKTGLGRKKDINLDVFETKSKLDSKTDDFLDKHKDIKIEKSKTKKVGESLGYHWMMIKGKWLKKFHND